LACTAAESLQTGLRDWLSRRKTERITLDKVEVGWLGMKGTWVADRAQQDAAWELYFELITTVSVQPLKLGEAFLLTGCPCGRRSKNATYTNTMVFDPVHAFGHGRDRLQPSRMTGLAAQIVFDNRTLIR